MTHKNDDEMLCGIFKGLLQSIQPAVGEDFHALSVGFGICLGSEMHRLDPAFSERMVAAWGGNHEPLAQEFLDAMNAELKAQRAKRN